MDGQNPFTITTVHVCCLFVGSFFSSFSQSLVLIYSMWKCCDAASDSVIGKTKQNNDKPGNCMFPKYDKYTHHWQTVYVNLNHCHYHHYYITLRIGMLWECDRVLQTANPNGITSFDQIKANTQKPRKIPRSLFCRTQFSPSVEIRFLSDLCKLKSTYEHGKEHETPHWIKLIANTHECRSTDRSIS